VPLPSGSWKANMNGVELDLQLEPPSQSGVVTGKLLNADFRGFWEESSQRIVFPVTVIFEGGSSVLALFTGYLFRTPTNPEPGRDVSATITGHFQMTPSSSPNLPFPASGTARRDVFGWYAQLPEIN
jgi:hypothetical protein